MKISEMPTRTFGKYDKLLILKREHDIVTTMPGEDIKAGRSPIDVEVEPATKEEFLAAVAECKPSDWYSQLTKDATLAYLNTKTDES